MTRILALDVGTSSVRAQVFDEHADEVGELTQCEYAGESDPDRLVTAVREALGAAEFDALGASSFGHSLLALDGDGRPLTPVLGHRRTGCHIHPSYWPAKLAWLASEQPDVIRSARRFVSFADYLYMRLLGIDEVPTSLSLASGTGLLDLATRRWDEELLDLLGIETERLPRIDDGPIRGWYPGLHDGTCANLGAGCVTRERAALTIGTSGAFRIVYATNAPQPRPGLFLYLVDDRRVVEGGAFSDGGNLNEWIEETLKDTAGPLADRDPDSHGLTFLTLLGGERSPGWHTHAKGVVHGLTFATTSLDLRQAALEGVAFRFAEVVELMPEVEEIVATGGALLAADDWLQIVADALGRPLTVSGVKEASLRGAAVITLGRLGKTVEEAPLGRVVEPRPAHAAAYAAARDRQRALYRAATGAETS